MLDGSKPALLRTHATQPRACHPAPRMLSVPPSPTCMKGDAAICVCAMVLSCPSAAALRLYLAPYGCMPMSSVRYGTGDVGQPAVHAGMQRRLRNRCHGMSGDRGDARTACMQRSGCVRRAYCHRVSSADEEVLPFFPSPLRADYKMQRNPMQLHAVHVCVLQGDLQRALLATCCASPACTW